MQEIEMSEEKWEKIRTKRDTKYFSSYKPMIEFYRDQSQSNNLIGAFKIEAVLLILLLILIVVTMIIFVAHCCCKILSTDQKP